ncbi:MAG: hypothetical protein GY734_08325 [Herbaspirillum sp.]|uniref:hypothetical protein n=1 Tax=Herbaspirillum sp. TaxID=1890675 RepID=UPI002587A4A9|nr:hypothetical protein [Herbaspirillum sp.]MCP3653342.1 hypothetical protein [Herbaspirillum sp.]MCP3946755.1 hypothetical protein [Herbaspirillum sp.]MCP4031231.1 hypothetical protein [Herbaspirillum sp.]MCP4554376.1 hypothetical protein [Herbaspirillum sp.]
MKLIYSHRTHKGTASIAFNPNNRRFHVFFNGEDLGSYDTAQQAADDIAGGHTYSHSSGVDTGLLGIPEDVSEWVRHA